MRCQDCQNENPAGANFCNECGSPLGKRCPQCGTDNPPRAKFCSECGEALALQKGSSSSIRDPQRVDTRSPTAAERRQLTVMFCDLSNSTEISRALDPEDFREMVCDYQECCAQVVDRFGGSIAQYLGDGILVYFGYPTAHEDDALRGVRAGLGILDAIRDLQVKVRDERSVELGVRIGIHTGLVVVGDVGGRSKREQLALGDTPNIAARLQDIAEKDSIAISAKTHQLTRGFFESVPLGVRDLKGVAEPMEVYMILKESGVRHRLEVDEGGKTPYVGRNEELDVMVAAWQQARSGHGRAVLITGEAGIGKSRLVRVFRESIAEDSSAQKDAYCSPYFGSTALYPIIELIRSELGLAREDSNPERLRKLRRYLGEMNRDRGEAVPLLASTLSIPPDAGYMPLNLSPQAQRQKTLEVMVSALLHTESGSPALLVVEDLHWIDPSSLDLLRLLIERVAEHPVLVLLTARPVFESPWSESDNLKELRIDHLPTSQTEDLIRGVTGGRRIPAEVMSLLVAKSDGIPLFIEEMTKMVLEGGMLRAVNDHYELAGSLPDLAIPSTLHDSLMARLDRMEAGAKEVAQVGACIGREFSFDLLSAVVPKREGALRRGLERLVEAELVFAARSQSTDSYSFKHALIQDAAYESLLKRTRQEVHERIAKTLERDFPDLVETQPERLAQHYTRAGQAHKAIPYWLRAGQKAVTTSANTEAVNHLKEGLKSLESLPRTIDRDRREVDFLSTLGTALSALQGYASPEVERTYARAQELCEEIGPTPQLFWVLWGLWAFYLVRGQHHKAVLFGEKMMGLGRSQADLSLELEAHFSLGLSYFFMGNLKPAREHLERAVSIYDPEKHHANAFLTIQDVGVTSRSVAALCLWHLGETDLAMERSRQALALADELAHPFSKAYALGCAAWFNLYLRDMDTARRHAREAVDLSTEQGFIWWWIWGTILGGRALADSGETAKSVSQMREGIGGWKQTGSGFTIPYFLALLSEACVADGRTEEAMELLSEARTLIDKTGEAFFEAELFRLEGELRLARNADEDGSRVEACFRRALDIARIQGAKAFELRAAMSLGRFWHERGTTSDAHRLLTQICSWFEGRAETSDLREARSLLASFRVEVN